MPQLVALTVFCLLLGAFGALGRKLRTKGFNIDGERGPSIVLVWPLLIWATPYLLSVGTVLLLVIGALAIT